MRNILVKVVLSETVGIVAVVIPVFLQSGCTEGKPSYAQNEIPCLSIQSPGNKEEKFVRFTDVNHGSTWEILLPADCKVSDYEREDGIYFTCPGQPAIEFYFKFVPDTENMRGAIDCEVARYLGVLKGKAEILVHDRNFRCGEWYGTFLQLYHVGRKCYINNYVFSRPPQLIVVGEVREERRRQLPIADFLKRLRLVSPPAVM